MPLVRVFCRSSKTGFTLIELLLVLGIIALVTAVGGYSVVKLMEAQTGRGSIEMLAAQIGQARAKAMQSSSCTGVVIYVDPATRRTALTIVRTSVIGSVNAPPSRYQSFDDANGYVASVNGDPSYADRVWHYYVQSSESPTDPTYRPMITHSLCIQDRDVGTGMATAPQLTDARDNAYWSDRSTQIFFTAIQGSTLLPAGVGAQVITGQGDVVGGSYVGRFANAGIILFDPNGRLLLADSFASGASNDDIGKALAFGQRTATSRKPLRAGIGIVTYDQRLFEEREWNLADDDLAETRPFNPDNEAAYSPARENAEESWLAEHGEKFFVSRYSGVISKAEQ